VTTPTTASGPDVGRLLATLPRHVRQVDAESGGPLSALLAVIAEQIAIVQDSVEQLYDDWFIETCADWVVPYLGDLVGYQLLRGYAGALASGGEAARQLAARLAPRRDVADTVATRRRKGTLPLLENVAAAVADWPARAVETGQRVATTEPVRLYPADAGAAGRRARRSAAGYVDVRRGAELDRYGTPFDGLTVLAEASRITAADERGRRQGIANPPAVALYAWRLKPYALTRAPAHCLDAARNQFTFSVLGAETPLVTAPLAETSPTRIATAAHVPDYIRRRAAADRLVDYYGPGKSFAIYRDGDDEPVPLSDIVVADLTGWGYRPREHQVAVDPELGRIVFGGRHAPERGVWVTYHYAFSDDMGGGEYPRALADPPEAGVYRVGAGQPFDQIGEAYQRWREDVAAGGPASAVVEICDDGAYQEQLDLAVGPGEQLHLRAAQGTRPTLRMLDWHSNRPDALRIRGTHGSGGQTAAPPRVVLDGLLISGRGVTVTGRLASVAIRDCTLVPGWSIGHHCEPSHPQEPSLVLEEARTCVQIERSIVGSILVIGDEVRTDPLPIHVADSILDATGSDRPALSGPDCEIAYAALHLYRSTVVGEVHTYSIPVGDNSILAGQVRVARRGTGCLRYCYVAPGSRTPRRFACQPDTGLAARPGSTADQFRPQFTAVRYGAPGYAQLADSCPAEITRGADDGAEMGAFHNLFQPQRVDNLRARLAELSPAGTDAGLVFVT
jgi:hypothetical protein